MLTTFGLGLLRPAPGTWGSLPPCVLCAAITLWGTPFGYAWYLLLAAILLAFGLFCSEFGHRAETALGKKDPSAVVADETAGMALTLLLLPWWVPPPTWLGALIPVEITDFAGERGSWLLLQIAAAFLAFRIFDILKLPPARGLQRLRGGLGILIDDLVAALQAAALVAALIATAVLV